MREWPPFRLMMIVSDERGIDDAVELAAGHPSLGFGAMLRDPDHRPLAVQALADAARRKTIPANLTLICNSFRPNGVAWLHLTSEQLVRMRELMPLARAGGPFGASVHSVEEALLAARRGASYIIASPVFPTASKPGHPGIGIDGLRAIASAVALPVFALGGIDGGKALACIDAGAYGIASISFFSRDARGQLHGFLDDAASKLHPLPDISQRTGMPVVLSIAGSDSGGGAGVQGDLKTFEAHDVFGTTAITAITAQNTLGVRSVHPLPARVVLDQMEAVFDDFTVAAVKIGMLADGDIVRAVAAFLRPRAGEIPIVIDPVMVSSSGHHLLDADGVAAVRDELLPLATLITPNAREATLLSGIDIVTGKDVLAAAAGIRNLGARAVLVTGGDRPDTMFGLRHSVDILDDGAEPELFSAEFIESSGTHGTGCALSSAIAANLANGLPLVQSIQRAKLYVADAIFDAPGLGSGHGPLLHRRPPQ
ncbi:MAG: phosphomethylpyrimidine kinase [Chlorobi bacterium]|nr:phosphomethylpyrimidine kinase [Chlorobiota bacterium]